MITFYATKGCRDCGLIEDTIEDLSLAHHTVFVEQGAAGPESLPENVRPPAMEDEHEIYSGHLQIMEHIDELSRFKKQWYKYQSDTCYVEDDEPSE